MNAPRRGSSPPGSAHLAVLRLAWPITLAMLGETAIGLVGTKLVGRLGATALAAVGVGSCLYLLVFVTVLGFLRAVKILTSHALGAGQAEHCGRTAWVGAGFGLCLGAAGAAGLQLGHIWLPGMGIHPEVVGPAVEFLSARALGLPAACALAGIFEYRQGLGQVWGVTAVMVAGNLVHGVAAYGLIYGGLGLPALGLSGAGLGATASEVLQVLVAAGWLAVELRRRPAASSPPPALRAVVMDIVRLGLPTALHFGCEFLALVAFTAVLGALPQAQVAASQIAIAINRAAFLPGLAFGEAASVLVGQALGRGDVKACDRAVAAAMHLALAYMAACGVGFLLFGSRLAAAFTADVAVEAVVAQLLQVAALFQLLDGVNLVMRGALRGAKDVRATAAIGICVLWACVPTAAVVLGRWAHMGVVGGWVGFVLSDGIAAAAFSWRFYRAPWRRRHAVAPSGGLA